MHAHTHATTSDRLGARPSFCSTSQGVVHVVARSIAKQGVHRGEHLASIAPAPGRQAHLRPRTADWSVAVVRLSEGAGRHDMVACATASGALSVHRLDKDGRHELLYAWNNDQGAKVRATAPLALWHRGTLAPEV